MKTTFRKKGITIRPLDHDDWEGFLALENAVWREQGIETVSEGRFIEWIDLYKVGFLGAFKGDILLGYSFCVRTVFKESFLYNGMLDRLAEDAYTHTEKICDTSGNAWYGVSFAALPQSVGVGYFLVEELLRRARSEQVDHFFCTVRLPQLFSYFERLGVHSPSRSLARSYVIKCVKLYGGEIHSNFEKQVYVDLPLPIKQEPVLALMVKRFGCILVDVVFTEGFEDAKSCNFSAALWRRV